MFGALGGGQLDGEVLCELGDQLLSLWDGEQEGHFSAGGAEGEADPPLAVFVFDGGERRLGFLEAAVAGLRPSLVYDFGANAGSFSMAAAAVLPTETLKASPAIDWVARKEFDFTCKEVAEGRDLSSVAGLSYRNENGKIHHNPERELIADMVESVAEAHRLDGLVLLTNCDKITPGMLMAAARLDIPCIVVTAGRIEHLASGFARTWQRPPTDAELKGLIDDYVKEEMGLGIYESRWTSLRLMDTAYLMQRLEMGDACRIPLTSDP